AEGRALRRGALRTGAGLAVIGLAALFAAAGLGLLLWTVFRGLSGLWGETIAALGTGVLALLVAGVLAWIAKRIAR
ncbi:MAG: hypothetical protein ABEK42_03190, partial [Thiohalorhabdaceae bacterium]